MTTGVTVRVRVCLEEPATVPRSAVSYAVRELARRAGVSAELFRTWRIEFDDAGFVDVYVLPGTNRRIRFAQAGAQLWKELRAGTFRTSTAAWLCSPGDLLALVPDFKIPFSSVDRENAGPLFAFSGIDTIECPVDLPLSTLLTLSRFEETLPGPLDSHGRFSAFSSVAWRDGFLHRPIVDEYGLALAQALSRLLPGWQPAQRQLRVKLGHDVDEIGLPFSLRSSLGHALRRNCPDATIRDLFSLATGADTSYQMLLRKIVQLSLDCGLDSAVYWKAHNRGPFDSGYDPSHRRITALIRFFHTQGVEMGVHPSYESFESSARLRSEVFALRSLLGEQRLGGRQDYLRWSPQSWIHWDSLGLAYDASVGFADHIGFRAGTSYPFRPWLLSESREAHLLEIPLLAMDSTLQGYMKLKPDQALVKLRECVARCRSVGGVFTLVWHNTRLMEARFAGIYRKLLGELAGSKRYDWGRLGDGLC
jgi:hypothetical protein